MAGVLDDDVFLPEIVGLLQELCILLQDGVLGRLFQCLEFIYSTAGDVRAL